MGIAFFFPLAQIYDEPVLKPVFMACSCIFAMD
jgi:hypothetical protein